MSGGRTSLPKKYPSSPIPFSPVMARLRRANFTSFAASTTEFNNFFSGNLQLFVLKVHEISFFFILKLLSTNSPFLKNADVFEDIFSWVPNSCFWLAHIRRLDIWRLQISLYCVRISKNVRIMIKTVQTKIKRASQGVELWISSFLIRFSHLLHSFSLYNFKKKKHFIISRIGFIENSTFCS